MTDKIPEDVEILFHMISKHVGCSDREAKRAAFAIVKDLGDMGHAIVETDRDDEEIPF